jgi:hypothetical protein
MLTFEKLIIINGVQYDIETDPNISVFELFQRVSDINNEIILLLSYGTEKYTINVSKLIIHHWDIATGTVSELINNLTQEMIYSFSTSLFSNNKVIRSFMSHDLPGDVIVSPYSIMIDEMSNTIYDPSYRDIIIKCADYDLNNVIPIIDNKMIQCSWNNKSIYIKDRVELAQYVDVLTFLSFGETSIQLHPLRNIVDNNYQISPNKSYILVLDGKMFFDTNYIFKINKSKNILELNDRFIMYLFDDFESFDKLVDDRDSFLIEVNSSRIFIRNMLMIPIDSENEASAFKYYEPGVQNNHVDYICLNNNDNTIHGLTIVDELYENVALEMTRAEHHVYIHNGTNNMRLIQLAIA